METANFESSGNAVPGLAGMFENPLTEGLFEDSLSFAAKSDGVGFTVGLDSIDRENLAEEIRLEQEHRAEERKEDLAENLFNGFNSNSLNLNSANSGGGGGASGFDDHSSGGELNSENQSNQSLDPLTGNAPEQALIPLSPDDLTSDSSSEDQEPVFPPEVSSEPNLETATNLAGAEPSPSSLTEELATGGALALDLPEFPTEAVEAQLEPNNNLAAATTQPNPTPPVFELEGISVDDSNMTLILDQEFLVDPDNPANQNFYFKTVGGPLGDREATLETGAATMDLVRFFEGDESQADRVLFIGEADGVTIYGNFFFGTLNWGYVTAKEGFTSVTYETTLDSEENDPSRLCCDFPLLGADFEPGIYGYPEQYLLDTNRSPGSIYAESGEFHQSSTDLYIPGRGGLDYSFTRHYRAKIDQDSAMGYNWDHEYFQKLEVQIDGSVVHDNGLDRNQDRYLLNETGDGFISPPEFFTELKQLDDGSFTLRESDGTVKTFDEEGKLKEIRDRNDNFMSFLYDDPDQPDQLTQVIDTMGRAINYFYIDSGVNEGRLDKIVDFIGREVDFSYNENGDLIEVTSPAVTDTPNGNDFLEGKTTRYTYSSGFANEALNHNLLTITRPNEVANGGSPVLVNEYGTSRFEFDKVVTQTYGDPDAPDEEVKAGGTYIFQYEQLTTGLSGDPNQAISRTTEIDRNGNKEVYEYNPLGYPVLRQEFTKGLRENEPEFFETRYEYNADGRLLKQIKPEGNETVLTYDDSDDSRFAQGNLLTSKQLPEGRGGNQTQIETLNIYEPIYQQVALSVDPRGLDPDFEPPIPDPLGRPNLERYSTRYFFDYQEADAGIVLPLLTKELGLDPNSQADLDKVQDQLDAAGIQLGLGDLNGDGVKISVAGNVVAMVEPSVVLLEGSNQEEKEGDRLQDIVTLYRYNQFGQMTSMVDPEGNVHTYQYYAENDPDGDGTPTDSPADERVLDTDTGGYLELEIRDDEHLIIDGHEPNNGSGALVTDIVTKYEYDAVGNVTAVNDGRGVEIEYDMDGKILVEGGIRTEYVVNELNQVVQIIRAKDVPDVGDGDPEEPLPLEDFAYIENIFFDFNDNVVKREVEDRGDTSNTGGLVDYTYEYDILDNLVTETQEVDVDTTLVTQYRYDANENLTFTLLPEGNATSALFDERDLVIVSTRGAFKATDDTLSPPPATNPDDETKEERPYDVRGGIPCQCTTYTYDGNRNMIKMVDSDDTDGSEANNGRIGPFDPDSEEEGDVTTFVYDGYDRQVAIIDAVGNRTEFEYDPVSNVIAQRVFGPIGGESPTDNDSTRMENVLLSEMLYLHDELNRKFQEDYVLFVADGTMTVRSPELKDGSLNPDDGKVTTRYEYDRKSRLTFTIEDDGDTYETQYDGADRQIKTIDPEGNMVEYAYDDNNNLIETLETDVAQNVDITEKNSYYLLL